MYLYNRLIEHIGETLHHLQFGFLKGKSTTSQLLQVLHDIGNKLDNKCQVDTLYLDFAKAFDKVNHELLLLKLKCFESPVISDLGYVIIFLVAVRG